MPMDGMTLIREAEAAGLSIRVQGERLVIRGPKRAAPVAERLIANKATVMKALEGRQTADICAPSAAFTTDALPPTWREVFEERAAIMEFDANMNRTDAEHFALADILKLMRRSGEM